MANQYSSKNIYQTVAHKQKLCSKCEVLKNIEHFVKDAQKTSGYSSSCKECNINRRKLYYKENKVKIISKVLIWQKKNPESKKLKQKRYADSEKAKITTKKWKSDNKEELNKKIRLKRKNDPIYKLWANQIKKISKLINLTQKTSTYVGCTGEELRNYLEALFIEDMSWDNYGSYWHVDHIIPCAYFDLSNEDEVYNCFHYSNLQPLEATKNMSKGSLYNGVRYRHDKKSK